MPPQRRKFQRRLGERPYRKLFVIAVEGVKTEPEYFAIFKDYSSEFHVKCLKSRHKNAPLHVLRRMKDYLKQEGLRTSDEAWLVVDKDKWTDEQLAQLHCWEQSECNYGLAVSNPKFEYWLLLHFEDGKSITSSSDCMDRLRHHLPGYDKGIDPRKISQDRIHDAIRRAGQRDSPPCTDWPRKLGGTTVYKLVRNILQT